MTLSSVTLVIPSPDVKFKSKVSFISGKVSSVMFTDRLLVVSPGLKMSCLLGES